MKEIKFSIIVCPGDFSKGLEETFNSVCNQDLGNYELIVIDRSSSNNIKVILEKYKKLMGDKLRHMSLGGANLTEAMNKGVKMAKGKYLSILESGEELEKDALSLALKSAEKYPQADVVYGVKSIWDLSKQKRGLLNAMADTLPIKNNYSSNLYYKKELHYQFGFYEQDTKIIEDYAFCLKAFYLGEAIVRPFDLITQEVIKS